jgi:nucleoside-diphosphate kinase
MVVQQCLVIIKPDGIQKNLAGEILAELSHTKLHIVGAKVLRISQALAHAHYEELKQKKPHIFEETLKYMQGQYHADHVMALVYEGENAIENIREVCGSTHPEEAHPTTIRGKYGRINSKTHIWENVVHSSDSVLTAKREIQLWFEPKELISTHYPTKKTTRSIEVHEWA